MADTTTKFTAGAIVPALEVWGGYQRFEFNDHFVKLQAYNKFIPFGGNSSVTSIESINQNLAGFRFRHETSPSSFYNYGTFSLNFFNNAADTTGTNIFIYESGDFHFAQSVSMLQNLTMMGNRIINVATGIAGTDAVNVDQMNAAVAVGGAITLTGDVTGTGTVGTPFATTFTLRLNQILTPNAAVSLNSQKINSLANGTLNADAVNLGQMNTAIAAGVSAGTITLTGNVTGSGTVGSSFSTTITSRLNQIPTPTGPVNINSQNMVSLGNVGIGVASPGVPLQFANVVDLSKIALYRTVANDYQFFGFGISSGTLRYSVDALASSHVFYAAASSTTANELFRITGAGNVGIGGVSSPNTYLQFPDDLDNCKISLYQSAANKFQVFGFGISSGTLRYSVGSSSNAHTFFCGASSTTSTELFKINGTGYATVKEGTGTIYCRRPSAHIRWSGTSSVASTGPWVKLNCSTVATAGSVQCTTSTNRITFTGSDLGTDCVGMVSASATIACSVSAFANVGIYKNGTTLLDSYVTSSGTIPSSTSYTLTVPNIMVTLSPGDYLEVWASTNASGTLSTQGLNLSWFAV